MLDLKKIPSPMHIAGNYLLFNCIDPMRQRPLLPRALCLFVTYRCNFRCRMCGIWKNSGEYRAHELSVKEFDHILSQPFFSKLEFVNINGGEPNLRPDLVEIVRLLIERLPRLKSVSLNSNGFPPEKTVKNVDKMLGLCRGKDISFSASISLHGTGKLCDKITGVRNSYPNIMKAFDGLRQLGGRDFFLGANCVITNLNLYHLDEMLNWSRTEEIPINFTLGEVRERFHNLELENNIRIKDKDYLVEFFRSLASRKDVFSQHSLRYAHLADMIEFNKRRTLACHYAMCGLILGSDGTLFYCKNSDAIGNCRDKAAHEIFFDGKNLAYRKKRLIKNRCHRCPPNTFNKFEVEKDLLKTLGFFLFN